MLTLLAWDDLTVRKTRKHTTQMLVVFHGELTVKVDYSVQHCIVFALCIPAGTQTFDKCFYNVYDCV